MLFFHFSNGYCKVLDWWVKRDCLKIW